MATKELENRLEDLKAEYLRIQFDLEKVESVGGNIGPLEQKLTKVEADIQEVHKQLRA
ncbi:hypothetical protein AJ85_01245 [Alkalihalobacillus alcalophilus ATCC 27647 = CGMCC 1.3604]|uniref:Uncharacterized protein n=1 Tax=Alkalihalobacillus alcalophilus ATCC 27647 = CGMCC 1.3604 TaxID=1218173 RepID=A0A4S4K2G1_ALKAL|nr:SE1832 family protein [Alkalihalobacillus alcalophilus]MED1564146.1 SE1832 family protein [Alkalihalobacillus alcalophilus]THG91843.1 hypothetical protein AJ85_01245 [Alkalihalobacillus alcalophilus ATCC 27647 = CGMCC 1.3604]